MGKVFKVSKNERELYSFTVPKEYTRPGGNDYVSYHVVGAHKENQESVKRLSSRKEYPSHVGTACYSVLRPYYTKCDITCVPYQRAKDPVIELAEAIDFFQIMAKHGIVAEKGIELREEEHELWGKGIVCHIEHGHPKPQRIYAALTCYRWIDSHPAFVWEFLKSYRCGLGLSAFQILPYLVAKYVSNCNHSFVSCSGRISFYDVGLGAYSKNPLVGVGLKVFFDEADKRGISYHDDGTLSYVNTAVSKIADSLSELEPKSDRQPQLAYEVSEPEDALHPKFKALYEIPNITKEQVGEILESLFTEGK